VNFHLWNLFNVSSTAATDSSFIPFRWWPVVVDVAASLRSLLKLQVAPALPRMLQHYFRIKLYFPAMGSIIRVFIIYFFSQTYLQTPQKGFQVSMVAG